MMYNPQLETFLCVVEAGSFSKAAEKMYITAPAVIKQINSLESSLNLQLFDRTHRGLIVTEAGKSLYKDTKYIIQYSKDSVARAQNAMKENKEVIRVGVSLHHRLAYKEKLEITDLYGENLLLMHRGWSQNIDTMRDEIREHHPEIHTVDFDFYSVEIFNRCENSNDILLAISSWESVHPLMKIIPVEWNYSIPFGLLYASEPSEKVKRLIRALEQLKKSK